MACRVSAGLYEMEDDLNTRLPEGFEGLDLWVDQWVLADSAARAKKRQETAIEDIRLFYEAVLAEAPRALEFLSAKSLGELDEHSGNLLKLLLSLAEVGPAVEWYGQPAVVDGVDADVFRLTLQISDTERQAR